MFTKKVNEKKKLLLQRKLSYYLRRYRIKKNITSRENSKLLGFVPSRYCNLESETKPYPKLISVYEFLYSLAELENMSVVEFVHYLEGASHNDLRKRMSWREPFLDIAESLSPKQRSELKERAAKVDKNTMKMFQICIDLFIKSGNNKTAEEAICTMSKLIKKSI